MIDKLKLIIFTLTALAQLSGLILLFINMDWALQVFIYYSIGLAVLILLLIISKITTKEENPNDYRDY
ncbi:hypothetical protein FZC66_18635 [Priestia megaterium]|nr:hypothetical protein FZC66_18635 [Priestia megaterium]